MPDTDPERYTITILNAPENTAYSLFFDGINQIIANGNTEGSAYTFSVPAQYKGSGKIKFLARIRTRTSIGIPFTISIEAKGEDIEIDIPPESWGGTPITPSKAKSEETSVTPPPTKKLIKSKLQEKVIKAEKAVKIPEETSSTPHVLRGPGGQFLSKKEKKFLGNKLQEKVQKAKESPVDTPVDTVNNDSKEKSSDINMPEKDKKSFWDRF